MLGDDAAHVRLRLDGGGGSGQEVLSLDCDNQLNVDGWMDADNPAC